MTLESLKIALAGAFLWTDTSRAIFLSVVDALVLALSALPSPTAQLAQSDTSSTLLWISVTAALMTASLAIVVATV